MILPGWVGMTAGMVKWNFWAFVAFEFCVGVYFPSICTIKSQCVPESHRATIYNIFRAPMNAIVVSVLLVNPDLMPTFKLLFHMLTAAGLLMIVSVIIGERSSSRGSSAPQAG